MNLKKLGNLIQDKRKELNLSIRKAAELIGISHNYLSIIEKANDPRSNSPIRPTIDTLKLISTAYKVDLNLLLQLSGYDFQINESLDSNKEDRELTDEEYEQLAKDIIATLIETGEIKAGEKITESKRDSILELVRSVIKITKS